MLSYSPGEIVLYCNQLVSMYMWLRHSPTYPTFRGLLSIPEDLIKEKCLVLQEIAPLREIGQNSRRTLFCADEHRVMNT